MEDRTIGPVDHPQHLVAFLFVLDEDAQSEEIVKICHGAASFLLHLPEDAKRMLLACENFRSLSFLHQETLE